MIEEDRSRIRRLFNASASMSVVGAVLGALGLVGCAVLGTVWYADVQNRDRQWKDLVDRTDKREVRLQQIATDSIQTNRELGGVIDRARIVSENIFLRMEGKK